MNWTACSNYWNFRKSMLLNNYKLQTMSRILLACLFATAWQVATAQNVKEEPLIKEMMQQFETINRNRATVSGWRIQLLATTDRQKLDNVRQTFQYRYPNIPVDWIHDPPYYKLRAGAYYTKLDAMRLKHILEKEYSGIYLVKDEKIRTVELVQSY